MTVSKENRIQEHHHPEKTLKNLSTAFYWEASSGAQYALYAERMRQQGYESLSNLFSACSFSEQVHASRHSKVTLFLGGSVYSKLVPARMTEVPMMIQDMLAKEDLVVTDYPNFIREAEEEHQHTAVDTFFAALESDQAHLAYCREATSSSDLWRSVDFHFYVCFLCGYVKSDNAGHCPICGSSNGLFIKF